MQNNEWERLYLHTLVNRTAERSDERGRRSRTSVSSSRSDPIRSKRHNRRRLRAMHTYSTMTTPPPRSSKARWSDRWDQQHDGVVLIVESICRQGFAYMCKVEEDLQKKLAKLGQENRQRWLMVDQKSISSPCQDGNGQGRAIPYSYPYRRWVQNSTRTRTHGYETLPIPIPCRYPYPLSTQRVDQILHKLLTILLLSIVHWG
jgi:hypothetical protein